MRVVCDTNVLISALHFGGPPRSILEKAIRGEVRLYLSEVILDELKRVLRRPKFGYSEEAIQAITNELSLTGYLVRPTETINEITEDISDNRILECAIEAKADYIVSGDSHLLNLKRIRSIPIVRPAQFMEIDKEKMKELE